MHLTNKEILEIANAAITQGDHEGFLSFCTDDTQWIFRRQNITGKASRQGVYGNSLPGAAKVHGGKLNRRRRVCDSHRYDQHEERKWNNDRLYLLRCLEIPQRQNGRTESLRYRNWFCQLSHPDK
jgi:hypothetical protein